MEHTTPITFPEDESFDIGQDTRTGVAMLEYRYDSPFKFTGKINKVTFKLEPRKVNVATGPVLKVAAVLEIATGLALLIAPAARRAMVARRVSDRHRHHRRTRGRNCVGRAGDRLLAGAGAARHVDL